MNSVNKQIALNTIFLYVRMLITMGISFFTVRIVLKVLGVEDYGIYNVVGGIVGLMSFFNSAMTSASQRFFSFALGCKDSEQLQSYFRVIFYCFFLFILLTIFILELLGGWFVESYLVIPEDKLQSALVVYQYSIYSFFFPTLSIPFCALIVSYEKMNVFAYVGILESLLRLLIVYLLVRSNFDKLEVYGFLTLLVSVVIFLIYLVYCSVRFKDICTFKFYWNKKIFSQILKYIGWNLFGAISGVCVTQGMSIVMNIYFGPLVNAAKAISDKVNMAIYSFVGNFYMAVNPQIVKRYAQKQEKEMVALVFQSSRLSFFLMFLLSWPVILVTDSFLRLWLGNEDVSIEMVVFVRLILIYSLMNVFEGPITQMIRATGRIKLYQIYVGGVTLLSLPFTIILYSLGFPAYYGIIAMIVVYAISFIPRLYIVRQQLLFNITDYLLKVWLHCIWVVLLVSIPTYLFVHWAFTTHFISFLWIIVVVVLFEFSMLAYVGLSKNERITLISMLKKRFIQQQR